MTDNIIEQLVKAGLIEVSERTISEITDGKAETKGEALIYGFDRIREGFRSDDDEAFNDGRNVLKAVLEGDQFNDEFMIDTITFLAQYVATGSTEA